MSCLAEVILLEISEIDGFSAASFFVSSQSTFPHNQRLLAAADQHTDARGLVLLTRQHLCQQQLSFAVISHSLLFDPPRGFVEPSFCECRFSLSKSWINHDDLRQNVVNHVASPLPFELDQNSFLNDFGLSSKIAEQFHCQTIAPPLRATPAHPAIQLIQITNYHDTLLNLMEVLRFRRHFTQLTQGRSIAARIHFRSLFTFSKKLRSADSRIIRHRRKSFSRQH